MKDKIKFLFIEMAYMLAVLVVSTIANPVQFLGKKVNEPITGGVMGYGVDYIYNPIAYIAGIVIFAGFAWVAYSRWYKSFADRTLKSGWKFVIVYVLIDLVMSFIMFIVLIFEALFLLGFDDNILPELLQFITLFCWPVALCLFMIAIMFPSLRKKD
ncbi:MAG: hypothetical protein K5871_05770 [Lachnospiraceae bacterium]|nr:hypothetical protein [Lachnospiraceae bacterium]